MNRKLMKQVIYGGFYLGTVLLIFIIFYFVSLRPAPTCFDQKQNQGEEEVDCGGPCESCEIRRLLPIRTLPGVWINSPRKGYSTILVQFQNPNPNYAVESFKYQVNIYGSDGQLAYTFGDRSFVYAGQTKSVIEADVPLIASRIARTEIAISETRWIIQEEFPLPAVEVRAVKTEFSPNRDQFLISGVFSNENPYPLSRVTLNATLYNEFSILSGLSKTFLENLAAFEERGFQIAVPSLGLTLESLGETKISVEAVR